MGRSSFFSFFTSFSSFLSFFICSSSNTPFAFGLRVADPAFHGSPSIALVREARNLGASVPNLLFADLLCGFAWLRRFPLWLYGD